MVLAMPAPEWVLIGGWIVNGLVGQPPAAVASLYSAAHLVAESAPWRLGFQRLLPLKYIVSMSRRGFFNIGQYRARRQAEATRFLGALPDECRT